MLPILTPSEMAALDAAAAEPIEVLIERAGAAVAHEALNLLGGGYGRRVVVLAGKGNNGADGRSAALRLRRRGVRVQMIDAHTSPDRLPSADLVIDAAFGTGFHGEFVAPEVGGTPVLAVDIPSGVDGGTGAACGRVLAARRTVTFAALKPGLVLEPGRTLAGEVVVADIGLDVGASRSGVVEADDVRAWIPPRLGDAHKWQAAVLVVAGSPGMTGAAHLVASAAQRAGAGMVRLASPGVPDDAGRPIECVGVAVPAQEWADAALAAASRCHSVVIGPGLGTDVHTGEAIRALVAHTDLPAVIDGDGLSALADDLESVVARRAAPTILTPHDGELAKLTDGRPGSDRFATARELATRANAVALLKGPTTVVASPDGRVRVITVGDVRLATAGTGDVLSGIIGALLARGLPPLEAAAAGAWLHARAGALGPAVGLVASDVVDRLPAALAEVSH